MTTAKTRFETSVLATPEAISVLVEQVTAFLEEQGVEVRTTHHTALIVDEVVTNVGTHGNCRDRPVRIAIVVEPDKVTGEIVDHGPPFDPRRAPEPSLALEIADRPIGGLGLHLVRQLTCTLEYERRNDENCMIFAIRRGNSAGEKAST
jgi:serine/threonine-protein kinase RsbW